MHDRTTIVTIHLPPDRDWTWHDDLNLIALASHLDSEGRQRALDEISAMWRSQLADTAAA